MGRIDGIYYDVLVNLIWEFTGEMVIDSQLNGIDHGDILGTRWDVDYPQIFFGVSTTQPVQISLGK